MMMRLVLKRLSALRLEVILALVPVQEINSLGSGRKSHQLDARLDELVQSQGLEKAHGYQQDQVGLAVPQNNDRDELRPCSSRLKLSVTGSWGPTPYLSDFFYMPYVEPRVNQFDIAPPS